jgi:hypothetical protein
MFNTTKAKLKYMMHQQAAHMRFKSKYWKHINCLIDNFLLCLIDKLHQGCRNYCHIVSFGYRPHHKLVDRYQDTGYYKYQINTDLQLYMQRQIIKRKAQLLVSKCQKCSRC